MNIEHKLEPIEHWIVDSKAYRLATEQDVGKLCYFSDAMLSRLKSGVDRCLHGELSRFNAESTDKYWSGGTCWKFAYIQDDSLIAPPTNPIDWTKPVRTKDGRAVRVLCTDGPGIYPVLGFIDGIDEPQTWRISGIYLNNNTERFDLENAPQRIQREYWVNVYEDEAWVHPTREEAKRCADVYKRFNNRLACVKITIDCEEGEGL